MRRLFTTAGPVLLSLAACTAVQSQGSSSSSAVSRTDPGEPAALRQTLDDLSRFATENAPPGGFAPGIRVGTIQGAHAADYLRGRFSAMGASVVYESFAFPQHRSDHAASSLSVALAPGATEQPITFDVFEGSGAGSVIDTAIEWVGTAKPEEVDGHDLHGKIAVVTRDPFYHRSSQYRNVANAGAVAMLYISQASNNQIQIGSVREAWEAMGPIPTVTIGKDDGQRIQDATTRAGATALHASIRVAATASRATGQNVLATIPGKDKAHRIVIGAHYDTWYTGSVDNGGGVAGLLALAELAAKRAASAGPPAYTLSFVAYDGEEVGLYGGYDYLRRHQDEGLLCALNLEMPSSEGENRVDPLRGIATSKLPAFDEGIPASSLAGRAQLYPAWLPLDLVAQIFGGIIPTDIQGAYRSGVPSLSTATDSPWYHTPADTPDKVDLDFLSKGVARFDALVQSLLTKPATSFATQEASLWDADLGVTPQADGAVVVATQIFRRNAVGQRDAPVTQHEAALTFFCDDFFASAPKKVTTDDQGRAQARFTAAEIAAIEGGKCAGRRFVHVTAGDTYPLVEKVSPILR